MTAWRATFGPQRTTQASIVAAAEQRRLSELRYQAGIHSRLELPDA